MNSDVEFTADFTEVKYAVESFTNRGTPLTEAVLSKRQRMDSVTVALTVPNGTISRTERRRKWRQQGGLKTRTR